MDDMLLADNTAAAIALGKLLQEHRGGDVVVMDLRPFNSWTDFFVIVTVTSTTHVQGLERRIKEFSQERGMDILRKSPKPIGADDEWRLIDLGAIVIHLMTAKTRSFYELERLWGAAPIYSSKSS
ncbi:MAG: ribosome silencing factor [Treponema sp.]|jgi:ribosome-associated protein|nr:ribosome silencing factor [Treponema sp.]